MPDDGFSHLKQGSCFLMGSKMGLWSDSSPACQKTVHRRTAIVRMFRPQDPGEKNVCQTAKIKVKSSPDCLGPCIEAGH